MVSLVWVLDKHEVEPVTKAVQVLYELQKQDGRDSDRDRAIDVLESLLDDTRKLQGWH